MESSKQNFDAIIIGSGIWIGNCLNWHKGAKVLILEKLLFRWQGGSFKRKGYTFDVGASMIFGFGEKGYKFINACTQRC